LFCCWGSSPSRFVGHQLRDEISSVADGRARRTELVEKLPILCCHDDYDDHDDDYDDDDDDDDPASQPTNKPTNQRKENLYQVQTRVVD
jgi:hypothetical protein